MGHTEKVNKCAIGVPERKERQKLGGNNNCFQELGRIIIVSKSNDQEFPWTKYIHRARK